MSPERDSAASDIAVPDAQNEHPEYLRVQVVTRARSADPCLRLLDAQATNLGLPGGDLLSAERVEGGVDEPD